jgi:hypothetical protein
MGRKIAGTINLYNEDGSVKDENRLAVYDFENNVLINSLDF